VLSGSYVPEYLANDSKIDANYIGAVGPGVLLGAKYYFSDNFTIESSLKFSTLPIVLTSQHKNITQRNVRFSLAWKSLVEIEVTNGNFQYNRDSNLNVSTVGIGFSSYF